MSDDLGPEAVPLQAADGIDMSTEQQINYIMAGRPVFSTVNVNLDKGERILADGGAMNWMDSTFDVETFCPGGIIGGCARCLTGESCFQNVFESTQDKSKINFGFEDPGDMLPFLITDGNGWKLTKKAFVAGTPNCKVTAAFPGCLACCTSGEGLLTKIVSRDGQPAMAFCGGFGEIIRHDVPAGQCLFVDNGLFFACHEKTKIKIGSVGGLKAFCCSGEGLVMKFFGPCVVFTQSRDPTIMHPERQDQV